MAIYCLFHVYYTIVEENTLIKYIVLEVKCALASKLLQWSAAAKALLQVYMYGTEVI